ncbi:ribosomal RNA-processing protein 8 [Dermatophagoides farinae]|uniref:ribosomal RNA-processing protein 8 n=1 Tax=Dermatophagoides farinae TaxID=6954 RepID=UPI003F605409
MATFQTGRDRRRLLSYLANNKSTKSLSTKNDDDDDDDDSNKRKKRRQQCAQLVNKIDRKDNERKSKTHDHCKNRMKKFNRISVATTKNDNEQLELRKDVECFLRQHQNMEKINHSDCDEDFELAHSKKFKHDDDDVEQFEQRSQILAQRAHQTLSASMFRYLNEFLYTHSSFEARKCFDSTKFQKYHQAYEHIMQQWPLKPIDYIIDQLKQRIRPTLMNRLVMADIGCGSKPRIAQAFPNCTVYSYDLYSGDDSSIISADMCRLPLDSDHCDYLIYSLSLMPQNLADVFRECNRILKSSNGYAVIVEVASRFADFGKNNNTNHTTSGKSLMENQKQKFAADFENFAKHLRQHYGFQLIEYYLLPPNDYFVYFILRKIETINLTGSRGPMMIQLKPCVYRHREPPKQKND